MIKCNKGALTLSGTSTTLAAESCSILKHLIPTLAERDKAAACALFRTLADLMAEIAEELVEKYHIPLKFLNMTEEELMEDEKKQKEKIERLDDDSLKEFLETLEPEDMATLLEIMNRFDDYLDDEEEDDD